MGDEITYRGAIIGLGNIALQGHLPSYLRLAPEVQIIAGVDKCQPNLEAFRNLLPGAALYTDYQQLLAEEELDFVDICTPPAYHCRIILDAARQGVSVLCEKPLAISRRQMEQIAEAVSLTGITLMPCHQYHYSPQWRLAKELINQGRIGRPQRFEARVLRQQPNAGNPHYKPHWRTMKEESGGGIVLDHGSHLFYLARHLLGRPRSISARLQTLVHHHDLEDTAWIAIKHEAGETELELTWAADRRHTHQCIIGDKGEIVISEDQLSWKSGGQGQTINLEDGLSKDSAHAPWYAELIGNFIRNLASPQQELDPLVEARVTLQCALLAYESARLGQPVDF
jgi:predicted dehydrogenase